MTKFDDIIEFVPGCPNDCKDATPDTMTRHQIERVPKTPMGPTRSTGERKEHRYLVHCPVCHVAYFALKVAP